MAVKKSQLKLFPLTRATEKKYIERSPNFLHSDIIYNEQIDHEFPS